MELKKEYMKFVDEVNRSYKGYRYIVRMMKTGYRNGYVKVNEEQFKKIKADFESGSSLTRIVCHGGITFTEKIDDGDKLADSFPEGCWIGFDCHHCCDLIDYEVAVELFGNTDTITFEKEYSAAVVGGHLYTSEEVEKECRNIIDQLIGGLYA